MYGIVGVYKFLVKLHRVTNEIYEEQMVAPKQCMQFVRVVLRNIHLLPAILFANYPIQSPTCSKICVKNIGANL